AAPSGLQKCWAWGKSKRIMRALGTVEVRDVTFSPHETISVGDQLSVDLFNVDDVLQVRLNDVLCDAADYFESKRVNMLSTSQPCALRDGSNTLYLELSNRSEGWTYGFGIRADGQQKIQIQCGQVGV